MAPNPALPDGCTVLEPGAHPGATPTYRSKQTLEGVSVSGLCAYLGTRQIRLNPSRRYHRHAVKMFHIPLEPAPAQEFSDPSLLLCVVTDRTGADLDIANDKDKTGVLSQ